MLLIGGIIAEIGLVGAFLVYLLTKTNLGTKLSAQALAAAQAGVDDAMLAVIRGRTSTSYTISLGASTSAEVTIGPGCPPLGTAISVPVTAEGQSLISQRSLSATLEVDCATSLVKIQSIVEQ
jgi:hypothetical protein